MKRQLKGIITPLITPFKTDGDLDLAKLRQHVDFLLENGVHGIFALGTAGEFALLSPAERGELLKVIVDEVNGKVPVLAGVSDPGTRNVVRYAKEAVNIGADFIVATGPYYFHTNEEGIYTHFFTLSRKVDKPIVVYNIPSATGHEIPLELAERLSKIGNIVAMKYTCDNLSSFISFTHFLGDKISMLIGADSLIYSSLEVGGHGAVAGCSNIFPKEIVQIYSFYQKGDLKSSLETQLRVLPFVNVMFKGTFPAALKEASKMLGRNVGRVRKPLVPLKENEKKMIHRALEEVGVLTESCG